VAGKLRGLKTAGLVESPEEGKYVLTAFGQKRSEKKMRESLNLRRINAKLTFNSERRIRWPRLKGRKPNRICLKVRGESQARNRYAFFASAAKKEGYVANRGNIRGTANHEKNTPSVSSAFSKAESLRLRRLFRRE
jgi:hypothetical protein